MSDSTLALPRKRSISNAHFRAAGASDRSPAYSEVRRAIARLSAPELVLWRGMFGEFPRGADPHEKAMAMLQVWQLRPHAGGRGRA